MRTTVDLPDGLLDRAGPVLAQRGLTLRSVVVEALERLLATDPGSFRLRDASAGRTPDSDVVVSSESISRTIDELSEPSPGQPVKNPFAR